MILDLLYFLKDQWNSYRFLKKLKKRYPESFFEKSIDIKGPIENLYLGSQTRIQMNCHFHLGGMEWCKNKGMLKIGKDSVISPGTLIYAAGPGGVEIGENFDCGPGVKIFASSSDMNNRVQHIFKKVTIGNNVILYANVVISPGVTIGDNAVVLAGGIVNRDIPKNAVFGGVPAKYIKTIN